MAPVDEASPDSEPNCGYVEPTLTFESLTFSDGTTVSLDPTDVVVLVGPNNAGKSQALRELQSQIVNNNTGIVVKNCTVKKVGSSEDLIHFLKKKARVVGREGDRKYTAHNFNISEDHVVSHWNGSVHSFRSLFCSYLDTASRLTGSNPANAINVLTDPSGNPIHVLFMDDAVETRISGYFRRAFNKDLIIFRLGGSRWPLVVGDRITPEEGEDRLSVSYNDRLRNSTVTLESQGDGMRSFATVILYLLAQITHSVVILDEPEAFLHPPQARLLGEILATERSIKSQLFVATHSPHVLEGLLNVASENLRIIRIHHDGGVNKIKELNKERAREISTDPLMKYSSVMSGVFHSRVIIAESDADCVFYSSILDNPEINGGIQPDVLFIHASGKHRMAALTESLKELGVTVDIIADIDILREDNTIERIVRAQGGEWDAIESLLEPLRKEIVSRKPWLNSVEIKKGVKTALDNAPDTGEFPREAQKEINSVFRKASPWDAIKDAGESAIPQGQATKQYHQIQSLCKASGLWIVPVGELEGFCKLVGGHGPRWVQNVVQEYDLSSDAELAEARKFVRELWESRA